MIIFKTDKDGQCQPDTLMHSQQTLQRPKEGTLFSMPYQALTVASGNNEKGTTTASSGNLQRIQSLARLCSFHKQTVFHFLLCIYRHTCYSHGIVPWRSHKVPAADHVLYWVIPYFSWSALVHSRALQAKTGESSHFMDSFAIQNRAWTFNR